MSNKLLASFIEAVKLQYEDSVANADPILLDRHQVMADVVKGITSNEDVKFAVKHHCGFDESDVLGALATVELLIASTEIIEQIMDNHHGVAKEYATEEPDAHITTTILNTINKKGTTTMPSATSTTATAAPEAAGAMEIAASSAVGINAMLDIATGGKIKDINKFLKDTANTEQLLRDAKQKVVELSTAASRPAIPTSGTSLTGTGELTYEVVQRKAYDLFPSPTGAKATTGLNFDVPTLVWKDAAGNVVQHPETPNVDPNYDFDMMQIMQYLIALNRNMNTWLFGHTGTGKSTFIEQIAARMGWPVSRVNLDSNLERADLVGHVHLREKDGATITQFEDGILPRAMQRPGFLLIDEIDAGRPDILFVIQRALENKGLMLTEDGGRVVAPHPLFRFAATANTRGQGDEFGMYAGTRTMNASMLDRFTAFLEFDYMEPKREEALLLKLNAALDPKYASRMAQMAKEIRTAFSKGELYNTISPRGLTVMADTFCTFVGIGMPEGNALQMALDLSVLNKVTNDTRQKIVEISTRVFGLATKKGK